MPREKFEVIGEVRLCSWLQKRMVVALDKLNQISGSKLTQFDQVSGILDRRILVQLD